MNDDDRLNYQAMVQRALRGVMREALGVAAEAGLPEGHHFYVSFETNGPGVRVPAMLADRYPEELTIVIQHQYWDLVADDWGFSVTLAFDGSRQRLSVPWDAVKAFIDPEAQFALRFEVQEDGAEDSEDLAEGGEESAGPFGRGGRPQADGADAESSSADPSADVVDIDRFRKDKD